MTRSTCSVDRASTSAISSLEALRSYPAQTTSKILKGAQKEIFLSAPGAIRSGRRRALLDLLRHVQILRQLANLRLDQIDDGAHVHAPIAIFDKETQLALIFVRRASHGVIIKHSHACALPQAWAAHPPLEFHSAHIPHLASTQS